MRASTDGGDGGPTAMGRPMGGGPMGMLGAMGAGGAAVGAGPGVIRCDLDLEFCQSILFSRMWGSGTFDVGTHW